jgi:hypothetical protein
MNGLIQMIENRGGAKKLNRALQAKVYMFVFSTQLFCLPTNMSRADLVGCLSSDHPPRFPFFDNGPDLQTSLYKSPTLEICPGFKNIITMFCLDDEIIAILEDVQHFADRFTCIRSEKNSANLLELDHIAAGLRHRLLSCASARQTTTQRQIIRECCRLGALIYLRTILQAFPPPVGLATDILLDKLKFCIDRVDLSHESKLDAVVDLMIWVLFICGIASSATSQGTWFISRLSSVANLFRLRTVDGVKSVLTRFFWVEAMHEGLITRLWDEIMFDTSLKKKEVCM